MHVDFYAATMMKLAALAHLTVGVYAIQSPGVPVSVDKAAHYALEATLKGEKAGIDPYELVGIARNESDFVENMVGPDGKDCGLTQTRVTITKFTCRQLRRSTALAFQEAAREMHEYDAACRKHADYDRCRLNHYNSGVRYAKTGYHGTYWLRVQCFADGARRGVTVADSCRRVRSRGDIARVLHRAVPRTRDLMAVASSRPAT
ncbi:MAG TPA: hypothetical protein VGL86_10870 [Polyangia bacterium]